MRVAFIVPHLRTPSGWRTASVGVIRALCRYADVEPVVIASNADARSAGLIFPDYPIIQLPEIQGMAFGIFRSWPRLVATWWRARTQKLPSVDLVHSLDAYPTGLVGHWLAQRMKVPHVLTGIGTYAVVWHGFRSDKVVYEVVLRKAAGVCTISNGTGYLMRRYFPSALKGRGVRVLLLGTDYQEQVPREMALNRQLESRPTIVSVGAVKRRKGYHVSIAAFAKVKSHLQSAKYLIIGDITNHSYYQELKQILSTYHVQDVEFLGRVSAEKLRECYQQASLFLLAPQQQGLHFEGFGLVYLEAGAYGLPVVGTRSGGVPDAVQDGKTGLLVKQGDVDGLANALLRLLTDKDLNRRMGLANRKWCETLTWERYAHEQYQVYKRALSY